MSSWNALVLVESDRKGVWKTMTIQRLPVEDGWPVTLADMICGVLRRLSDEDPEADGGDMQLTKLEP